MTMVSPLELELEPICGRPSPHANILSGDEGPCDYGEPAGTRTQDPRLKRALLYQLSYELTPVSRLTQALSGFEGALLPEFARASFAAEAGCYPTTAVDRPLR